MALLSHTAVRSFGGLTALLAAEVIAQSLGWPIWVWVLIALAGLGLQFFTWDVWSRLRGVPLWPSGWQRESRLRLTLVRKVLKEAADYFDSPSMAPAQEGAIRMAVIMQFIHEMGQYWINAEHDAFQKHTPEISAAYQKKFAGFLRRLSQRIRAEDIRDEFEPPVSFDALVAQKR